MVHSSPTASPDTSWITQAGHGGHHHLVAVAGDGMGGERHPGCHWVHHRLHQHRHPGGAATVPLVICRRPALRCVGGETPPHRLAQPFNRRRSSTSRTGRRRTRPANPPQRPRTAPRTAAPPRLRAAASRNVSHPSMSTAAAVTTRPGGTANPAATSSPRTRAFPPTFARSAAAAWARSNTSALASIIDLISSITNYCDATLVVLC